MAVGSRRLGTRAATGGRARPATQGGAILALNAIKQGITREGWASTPTPRTLIEAAASVVAIARGRHWPATVDSPTAIPKAALTLMEGVRVVCDPRRNNIAASTMKHIARVCKAKASEGVT